MHMSLVDASGQPDMYAQDRTVLRWAKDLKATSILELGCGKGANLNFLRRNLSDVSLTGMDLYAAKSNPAGYKVVRGDYRDMSMLGKYDIIFAIETLCYVNLDHMLKEIEKHLNPGGVFIMFDAFDIMNRAYITPTKEVADKLICKGMCLDHFNTIDSTFTDVLNEIERTDYTKAIMKNAKKFESLAKVYLKTPAHILANKMLVSNQLGNIISGYLMIDSLRLNMYSYQYIAYTHR